jgi:hypothetical protein
VRIAYSTRCHALVLTSRCEGLPLSLVEAMLSGRVPIVTDVGGNREVVNEACGFLAASASEAAVDVPWSVPGSVAPNGGRWGVMRPTAFAPSFPPTPSNRSWTRSYGLRPT